MSATLLSSLSGQRIIDIILGGIVLTNINVKVTRQTIQKGRENIQCSHLNLEDFYSRIYFNFYRILIFFAISCPFSDVKQINGIFEIKNWQKKRCKF